MKYAAGTSLLFQDKMFDPRSVVFWISADNCFKQRQLSTNEIIFHMIPGNKGLIFPKLIGVVNEHFFFFYRWIGS